MKRVVLFGATLTAAFALSGCPIYPQSSGCSVNADCPNGLSCDPASGFCYQPNGSDGCTKPSDCAANETCGSDGQCDPGDCTFNGCVSGYQCAVSQGVWACVLPDAGAPPDSGSDAPIGADSGPDVATQDSGPDSSGSAGSGGAAEAGPDSSGAGAGGSAGASAGGSAGASAGGSAGANAGGAGGATDAGSDAAPPADAGNG